MLRLTPAAGPRNSPRLPGWRELHSCRYARFAPAKLCCQGAADPIEGHHCRSPVCRHIEHHIYRLNQRVQRLACNIEQALVENGCHEGEGVWSWSVGRDPTSVPVPTADFLPSLAGGKSRLGSLFLVRLCGTSLWPMKNSVGS